MKIAIHKVLDERFWKQITVREKEGGLDAAEESSDNPARSRWSITSLAWDLLAVFFTIAFLDAEGKLD